ncbi:MAG: polysaccharide biosynthesis tyrosine autokinase [Cyanobacteria bacterium]|nr:polysaccharide biosynthesis tyrosine autokinase [Cyanobacteria bacterium CG_2015-16_32_12]NCO79058.1 polysaccharide biosynthesis tyrosine autokinase [Cyanobacteria bacterium CG_2015-22_32_23]NCQ05226.1 polysaccharide biosynthesis tyrosine autokinase [Cyanobacteria bacterium CG_2015-09_32_10]NCQ42388.1 polysaccharide biosynthesis tyrosine autokinase [Cyanobacteria bacterium CG_2015-04_32_10]NCS86016.1 polysaccharide biosynthesis tyrosine autokinase [Cyanobacteria bacterium CG_2015-02_32_10]
MFKKKNSNSPLNSINNNPQAQENHIIPSLSMMSKKSDIELDHPDGFSQVFSFIKRRWLVFSTVTIGVTAIVGFWTYQQSPIYQGKFMLLLEKSEEKAQGNNNNINQTLSPSQPSLIDYNTEIEILGSASILMPILEEVSVKYPDIYNDINLEKLENLSIKKLENTKIVEVTFKDKNPEKIKFVLDKIATSYLKNNLAENKNNINEGLKFVRLQVPQLQNKVTSLQTQLQTLRQEYGFIDPQIKATELTQQLIDIEKEYFSTQVQLKQANSAYNNIQKQLNLSPEQAIAANYLTESPKYQNLLKQLQELEVELAVQSAIYTDESPQIITLQEKRENLTNLLKQESQNLLSKQFGDITVQQSITLSSPNQIRTKLTEELLLKVNEIKMLETKVNSFKTVLEDLNKRVQQMPILTRQYTDIQRELQSNTDSLKRFLETREKLELEQAQKTVNWKVITPPKIPEDPIYPIPRNNLIIGFIGGLILGIITSLIVDKLDGSIHTLEQLKEVTKQPILGKIPIHKNIHSVEEVIRKALPSFNTTVESNLSWMPKTPQPQEYTSSYWIESFRNLYTNVSLLGSDSPVNSLVITSGNPAEGKSTISLNLAQGAAAMGQKVLLIDGDLRLPQLHRLMGIDNDNGLSNVLAMGFDLNSAIKEVPQWENLSVITAGQIPPDPTRLLHSQKMQEIIKQLKESQQFDLIIFDSPSILGFSDAKIIAPNTNGLVLVVKLGKIERTELQQVTEQLKMSHIPFLGIVANGIKYNDQGGYYRSNYHNYYKSSKTI